MAQHARPSIYAPKKSKQQKPPLPKRVRMPLASPRVLPFLVLCSLALSAGMAFGNPVLWTASDQWEVREAPAEPAAEAPQEEEPPAEGDEGESSDTVTISEYQAISQSEDDARAKNIKLAADAINGQVIEPGQEFSFNDTVGDTTTDKGYKEAPVINNGEVSVGDGGGVCQVSTALYIAAVEADLEITERHPHSVPSDYAPIGLDATIVYGSFDLRILNDSENPITIRAEAEGQKVKVSIEGKPLPDGLTVEAVSHVTGRYHDDSVVGDQQEHWVTDSFRVYYQDGVRTERELLASGDIYVVNEGYEAVMGEGSVDPNK